MGAGKDPFSHGGAGVRPVDGRWGAEVPVPGCSPLLSLPAGHRLPGSLFLLCPISLSHPCLGFGLSPDCDCLPSSLSRTGAPHTPPFVSGPSLSLRIAPTLPSLSLSVCLSSPSLTWATSPSPPPLHTP